MDSSLSPLSNHVAPVLSIRNHRFVRSLTSDLETIDWKGSTALPSKADRQGTWQYSTSMMVDWIRELTRGY